MHFVFMYPGGLCAYKNNDESHRKIYIFQGSKRIAVIAFEEWMTYSPYKYFSTNNKVGDMALDKRKEIENNELEQSDNL